MNGIPTRCGAVSNMDTEQSYFSNARQQAVNAALAALAKTGDAFALGQLWEINKGLLRSLFWKWYTSHKALADAHGLTVDDFEQEGFFAVQYAAEHYDPVRGSFATALGYAAQRQLRETLCQGHTRRAIDEAGRETVISANPLNHCASLDVPLADGTDTTLGDTIVDESSGVEQAEEHIYHQQLHADLDAALDKLSGREQAVIRSKFYDRKTIVQISEEQRLTVGQVNTAKNSALRKLRRNPRLLRWREEIISTHSWRGTSYSTWEHSGSVEERIVELLECNTPL